MRRSVIGWMGRSVIGWVGRGCTGCIGHWVRWVISVGLLEETVHARIELPTQLLGRKQYTELILY